MNQSRRHAEREAVYALGEKGPLTSSKSTRRKALSAVELEEKMFGKTSNVKKGGSKKDIMEKTRLAREKRAAEKRKTKSASTLQAFCRSRLVARRARAVEVALFDKRASDLQQLLTAIVQGNPDFAFPMLALLPLLRGLLFFYANQHAARLQNLCTIMLRSIDNLAPTCNLQTLCASDEALAVHARLLAKLFQICFHTRVASDLVVGLQTETPELEILLSITTQHTGGISNLQRMTVRLLDTNLIVRQVRTQLGLRLSAFHTGNDNGADALASSSSDPKKALVSDALIAARLLLLALRTIALSSPPDQESGSKHALVLSLLSLPGICELMGGLLSRVVSEHYKAGDGYSLFASEDWLAIADHAATRPDDGGAAAAVTAVAAGGHSEVVLTGKQARQHSDALAINCYSILLQCEFVRCSIGADDSAPPAHDDDASTDASTDAVAESSTTVDAAASAAADDKQLVQRQAMQARMILAFDGRARCYYRDKRFAQSLADCDRALSLALAANASKGWSSGVGGRADGVPSLPELLARCIQLHIELLLRLRRRQLLSGQRHAAGETMRMVAEDLTELVGMGSGKVGMVAWKQAKKQLKELTEEQKAARRRSREGQYAAHKRGKVQARKLKQQQQQQQKQQRLLQEAQAAVEAENAPPSESALRRKRRNERAVVEAAKARELRAEARVEADKRKLEANAARADHELRQMEVAKARAAVEEAELQARATSTRDAAEELGRGEAAASIRMAQMKKGLEEKLEGEVEAEARRTRDRLERTSKERVKKEAEVRMRRAVEEEATAKARAEEARRAEVRQRVQEEKRKREEEEAKEARRKEAIEKGDIWDDDDDEDDDDDSDDDDDDDDDLFWGPIGGSTNDDASGGGSARAAEEEEEEETEAASTDRGTAITGDDDAVEAFNWVRPARAMSRPMPQSTRAPEKGLVNFNQGGLTIIDDDDGLFQYERDRQAAEQPSIWLQPQQPQQPQQSQQPPQQPAATQPPPSRRSQGPAGAAGAAGARGGGSSTRTGIASSSAAVASNAASANTATFVLDGANIGYNYGRWSNPNQRKKASLKRCFGSRGLELALRYYNGESSGAANAKHRAVAFLPQRFLESRYQDNLADDVPLLLELNRQGQLFITPSGADDDHFIIKYAQTRSNRCVIVTNDNMADHIAAAAPSERNGIRDLVCRRTVKYMFVGDEFLPLK
jgi:hypothetical protein